MDSTFDFDLAGGWLNAAMLGEAGRASRAQAVTAMVYPPGHCSTFLTNHDQPRLMTELRRGKAVTGGGGQAGVGAKRDVPTADEATALGRAKVAAALLLLSPGSPFLYYGEEIGMTGDKPDPKIRTPMQWTGELPGVGFTVGTKAWAEANADAEKVNVAAQSNNAGSLWSWYRDLIRLRRDHAALRRGSWRDVHTHHEGVYGFTRRLEETGETLLVVMNLTGRPAEGVKLFTFEPEPFGEVPNPPLAPDKMPTVKLMALLGPAPLPARLGANGGLMGYTPLKAIPADGVRVMAVGE
jgi:glycosidase